MRFDCGREAALRAKAREQWHRWFAWYPVRVSDESCRWLEWVERRIEPAAAYDGVYLFHYYRSLKG